VRQLFVVDCQQRTPRLCGLLSPFYNQHPGCTSLLTLFSACADDCDNRAGGDGAGRQDRGGRAGAEV
jgi:hypothetical protein